MPHGGLHWAKVGPIIRRRPGNLAPLKGAHLSPNRWSTACGRGYILSPLRGSLGCVKHVDASRWERAPRRERSEREPDRAKQVINGARVRGVSGFAEAFLPAPACNSVNAVPGKTFLTEDSVPSRNPAPSGPHDPRS